MNILTTAAAHTFDSSLLTLKKIIKTTWRWWLDVLNQQQGLALCTHDVWESIFLLAFYLSLYRKYMLLISIAHLLSNLLVRFSLSVCLGPQASSSPTLYLPHDHHRHTRGVGWWYKKQGQKQGNTSFSGLGLGNSSLEGISIEEKTWCKSVWAIIKHQELCNVSFILSQMRFKRLLKRGRWWWIHGLIPWERKIKEPWE